MQETPLIYVNCPECGRDLSFADTPGRQIRLCACGITVAVEGVEPKMPSRRLGEALEGFEELEDAPAPVEEG